MTDEQIAVIQAAREWRRAMSTANLLTLVGVVDALEALEEAQDADSQGADGSDVRCGPTEPAASGDSA